MLSAALNQDLLHANKRSAYGDGHIPAPARTIASRLAVDMWHGVPARHAGGERLWSMLLRHGCLAVIRGDVAQSGVESTGRGRGWVQTVSITVRTDIRWTAAGSLAEAKVKQPANGQHC